MLGDLFCTSEQCDAGAASVSAMDSVFQSSPVDIQSQFQSAHDSIMSSFNNTYSWYDRVFGGFSPSCCTVKQIGAQADNLTALIQTAMGQTPAGPGPGSQPENPLFSNTLVWGLAIVAGIFILAERKL